MDNEKFGKFIQKLRKEKNMTQKQLGEKLNITDKAISKWERGLSFPDISMLNSNLSFSLTLLTRYRKNTNNNVHTQALKMAL